MEVQKFAMGIVFILFGLGIAYLGVNHYIVQDKGIDNAEPITVTIESTEIVEQRTTTDSGDVGMTYDPEVRYSYTFDGKEYTSGSIYPGTIEDTRSKGRAEDIVSQFPEGSTVEGYVNSKNPDQSYLIKESDPIAGLIFLLLFGAMFVVFGYLSVSKSI